ncbi:hypothetical protein ACWFRJ_39695 [Streptomyces sp. NPDC055239]
MDVDGQYVSVGVVAFVGGEGGFDSRDLARLEPTASVDDLALSIQDDGVEQPVFLDVGGEGFEIFLVE